MVGEIDPNDPQFVGGHEVGAAETAEELRDRMYEQGFDPDEIEALFDPAPKRGRGHKKHHVRRYDPAPKKRKVTAKHTGKKGKMMAAIKKFVPPGIGLLTFYGAYVKRAEDLFNAGLIPEKSIFKAIEYDIKNFNGQDAMNRVKSNAGNIAVPFIGGWAVKETGLLGKWSNIVGESATWYGIATLAKVVLDPPQNGSNKTASRNTANANAPKVVTLRSQTENAVVRTETQQIGDYNPYMPGRGY